MRDNAAFKLIDTRQPPGKLTSSFGLRTIATQLRLLNPLIYGGIFVAITICVWAYLDHQRDETTQAVIHAEALDVTALVLNDMQSRKLALQRLVNRWQQRGGTPKDEFFADADAYTTDLPGFKAIEWVDKNYRVRWIVPLAGNEKALGLNLANDRARRETLGKSLESRTPTMSSPIELVQGGQGILVFFPIYIRGEFDGFILGVFETQAWLNHILAKKPRRDLFNISIMIDGESIYRDKNGLGDPIGKQTSVSTDIMGHSLTVGIRPTWGAPTEVRTILPELVSAIALAFSVALVTVIFLSQRASLAAETANLALLELKNEIAVRINAEREARAANLAKSQFLSSMSHELRTPLNAVLGFAQLLKANPAEPLTDDQEMSVQHILKGGTHLLDLVNDVLDLAKIEAGKVNLSIEDIQICSVLNECIFLLKEMAENKNIQVTPPRTGDEAWLVRADLTRAKQVLLNLLSNSIKYNVAGGAIKIECRETPEEMLRISVSDTGRGIAKDLQPKMFQPFSRLGAENSDIEGSGIGLVVCKDLVELMNGKLGFESEENIGSTFFVELPIAGKIESGNELSLGSPPETNADILKATMLYVEDNPSNLKLMEAIISRLNGLTLLSAHSAELGIEIARNKKPDLILLDINLPGMDGFAALKELRSLSETKDIPVLALSANATKDDIRKGEAAGFSHYLTKPINVQKITDAILHSIP